MSTSRRIDVEVLADAAAGLPQHAQGMRLVDHQQGLVPLLQVDELGQIGDVAVHAVDALDDDQHAAIVAAELGQHRVGRPRDRCA